jgi:hypothetical protein
MPEEDKEAGPSLPGNQEEIYRLGREPEKMEKLEKL